MKNSLVLCMISGLLLALSFPIAVSGKDLMAALPNGLLIFVALVPFFFALKEKDRLPHFFKGLIAGSVFFLVGMFWITVAMHLYGGISIFGSVGILLVAVLFQASYMGLYAYLIKIVSKRFTLFFSAPVLFVGIEFLRTYFVAGYTWLSPAYALVKFEKLIQVSDILGVSLLNLFIVYVNLAIYEFIDFLLKKRGLPRKELFTAAGLTALFLIYGFARVGQIDRLKPDSLEKIALVQGNISQDEKWTSLKSTQIIDKYLKLSESSKSFAPSLVVWPEASLPMTLDAYTQRIGLLARTSLNSRFLVGAVSSKMAPGQITEYNSAFYVSPDSSVLGRFDKIHLVPFSEEVLFESQLPFIRKLIPPVAGVFRPGDKFTTFDLFGHLFGVLICFEAIFPDIARTYARNGADFLVNITNDAWFGLTSGPYQHIDMARFRAIENRIPIVRAANTGISGLIDAAGRLTEKTEMFTDRVLNVSIGLKKIDSIYTRVGDLLAWVLSGISIIMIIMSIRTRRQDL